MHYSVKFIITSLNFFIKLSKGNNTQLEAYAYAHSQDASVVISVYAY